MIAPERDFIAPEDEDQSLPPLMRSAIWVAIGALIAAALVCVVWVLIGEQNGIVARAFVTVLLLASFAGVTILDVHLAPRRPAWFALASMATWIVLLLIGAVMIWMPEHSWWDSSARFINFLVIVLIFQLALLHVRLYTKAFERRVTTFTQVVAIVTISLVAVLAVLLALPLMLSEWVYFSNLYGRIVVAVAILVAVGTALLPLVNVLFAPRKRKPAAPAYGSVGTYATASTLAIAEGATVAPTQRPTRDGAHAGASAEPELLPWPNYVDGATPLPMLPDGSPDWNAYYTGYPAPGAYVFPTPSAAAPEASVAATHEETAKKASDADRSEAPAEPVDYRDFPPPPPLPPQS
ncbi:hypothetical protein ACWPKO_31685 (plasmid) [Coraliomargarita sp. W4R53]